MLNKSVFPRLCSVFSKLDGHTYCVVGMQNIVRKKGAAVRNVYYFNIDPIVAWEKANTKTGARTAKSAKGKSRGSMQIPVKSGAIAQAIGSGRDGVQIGAASVAGGDSGDSGPRLISTTGGGGGSGAWASFAALKKAADSGDAAALQEQQMLLERQRQALLMQQNMSAQSTSRQPVKSNFLRRPPTVAEDEEETAVPKTPLSNILLANHQTSILQPPPPRVSQVTQASESTATKKTR